jgi:chorismate dehydratase
MRVGRISYLNLLPFYHALDACWEPYVEGTPASLAQDARLGRVDAAPLPLVETFYLESEFEPLSNFGIGCRGRVGSVLLFSHKPFDQLSGTRLLFSAESSTSVALARYLLDRAGNSEYRVERGDRPDGYDGYLAIGDRALRASAHPTFEVVTDLSERWHDMTHYPFVFARWVVRKSVSQVLRKRLAEDLSRSLSVIPIIPVFNSAGLSPEQARAYLSRITYRLDEACLEGALLFRKAVRVLA